MISFFDNYIFRKGPPAKFVHKPKHISFRGYTFSLTQASIPKQFPLVPLTLMSEIVSNLLLSKWENRKKSQGTDQLNRWSGKEK